MIGLIPDGQLYALVREMDGRKEIRTLGLDEQRISDCANERNSHRSERDRKIVELTSGYDVRVANYYSESTKLYGNLDLANQTSNGPVVHLVTEMSPEHAGISRIHGAFVDPEIAGGIYSRLSRSEQAACYSITPYTVEL